MNQRILAALTVLTIIAFASSAMAECSVADVQIKDWKWRVEDGWFFGVGEIATGCATPVGVQVQITMRDATGGVVNVDESWPASTRNIPPGVPYPFKTMSRAVKGTAAAEVRAIAIQDWEKR